jgi:hypothetical protein
MLTKDAIRYYGGFRQLAGALKIDHKVIPSWGDKVPQEYAYRLNIMTNGMLGGRMIAA